MNKFIIEQLQKCKHANVPVFEDNTIQIIIPKIINDASQEDIQVGKRYVIEVEDYIIHPFDGFDLHKNWNANQIPTDTQMMVEVTQVMGKMVKVFGIGQHDRRPWEGWLPRKSFKIISNII